VAIVKPGRRYLDPNALSRLANMKLIARTVVEGFISGLHQSPYHGFSVEFAEYREYVPGDDLKHFDWRAFARCDKHYIKQYQEETNLRANILIDCSRSMAYSSNGISKFTYACYLAASLAYLMIRQQDSVGMVIFDDKIRHRIPAKSSPAHLRDMLVVLENTEPSSRTGIAPTLHAMAEGVKKRGLIIIISDLLENQAEVLRGIKHFRHNRHEVLIFHVLDRAELNFPFSGLTTFRDMETGDKLMIEPQFFRQEYMKMLEEFIKQYKRECAEGFVDYLLADTSSPFDLLLANYLAKRARLG
jgi:uncharacterized protein (DUF58 family)